MSYYLTEKQVEHILRKMFKVVGQEFKSIKESCKDKEWYLKHTWTEKQEAEFRKWLTSYIVKKLDISVRSADKRARMFLFMCGWRYAKGGDVK